MSTEKFTHNPSIIEKIKKIEALFEALRDLQRSRQAKQRTMTQDKKKLDSNQEDDKSTLQI